MQTSRGRAVEVVPGDAPTIESRGASITLMGDAMIDSAVLLKGIGDDTIEGEGYAMDKIQEVVGTVHVDLDEAGRRYRPAGAVLTGYASALETAQSRMRTIVADAEASLAALQTAQADADDADAALSSHETSVRWNPPSDDQQSSSDARGDSLASAASSAALAVSSARDEHEADLAAFDVEYDTWEDAYERAVGDLADANEIGADSTWENIAGVLAVVAEIVGWVGLAIAVLGLIIGGPFFAIAALVVGVIALGLTIALMFDGRKGWGDLFMAVVGILPIGKLGKIFGGGSGRLARFGGEFVGQFRNPVQQLTQLRGLRGLEVPWNGAIANRFGEYTSRMADLPTLGNRLLSGLDERFLYGANRSFHVNFLEAFTSSGGPQFRARVLAGLPEGLEALTDAPSNSIWEAAYNSYRWMDRGFGVANGQPSGGLSSAGLINGLTS